jgi:UDP-N-acetylmuramoyl-tripeptide--D-alanyl-D-alanine ligase
MQLRTSDLAAALDGRLDGPDVVVDGATIDSRAVRAGQLFVPIVAERDGHDFIPAALEAGAVAYLSTGVRHGGTAVLVDDTVAALQAAGRLARAALPAPVVGVTGSVGKTSVKDLLAAALGAWFRTAASERSFNNELGVPLTLLGAPDGTEAVVVEMGARGVGHIAELCAIASPTIGVVTRVAAVHTEVFGSIEEVARTKGELVEALPFAGTAVLNADDERVAAMAGRTTASVLTYGSAGEVRALDLRLDDSLHPRFRLVTPWGEADVALAVRGLHQAENALAAAAAALAAGVDLAAVAAALGTAELSPWRMDLRTAASGARVLNDAYNANPTSVRAALASLAALPAERRIAVVGRMAELGPSEVDDHQGIVAEARRLGIEVLAVGTSLYGDVPTVADVDAALDALGELTEADAVLVKGSRVAGLERLAERLLDDGRP